MCLKACVPQSKKENRRPNKDGGFFKSHAAAEELAGLLPEGAEEAVWAACARFSVLCCASGRKAR